MSTLPQALSDYLTMRRALGFKLEREGQLLARFVDYAERLGAEHITLELAVTWATQPIGADRSWHSARLSAVRGFAQYLSTIDEQTQIPPADVLPPGRSQRAVPYLYSDAEIAAVMAATDRIHSPLRAATYATLIGLLAATGMRVGEAIALDRDDVECDMALLTVRDSKFGKSRALPLHPTTVTALVTYARLRNRLCPAPVTPAWFISTTGTRLIYKNVHREFHRLTQQAGLHARSTRCRPRPHDLRHTFAVATLLGWYRDGDDVHTRLPLLSTYLGHAEPSSTYWYLAAAPELLALAAQRLQNSLDRQERP
ncbi:integrase [Kibdelosporangium banguiense]|uniref:Integrase n=1 Tax=Kibdelosporangium banguiense TaxID=1365924 RepID=A0ABS4TPE7_9PSEU|nr:tyrosine-type recombinase/integrase [Kibdelosporangium banguiense]MBP2325869.1 integrase [Kibdelosporangium banguiense]